MAESRGFEPLVAFTTPVFKTGTLSHYANSPEVRGTTLPSRDFPGVPQVYLHLVQCSTYCLTTTTFSIGWSELLGWESLDSNQEPFVLQTKIYLIAVRD